MPRLECEKKQWRGQFINLRFLCEIKCLCDAKHDFKTFEGAQQEKTPPPLMP